MWLYHIRLRANRQLSRLPYETPCIVVSSRAECVQQKQPMSRKEAAPPQNTTVPCNGTPATATTCKPRVGWAACGVYSTHTEQLDWAPEGESLRVLMPKALLLTRVAFFLDALLFSCGEWRMVLAMGW
jgi:hypothetical protein